MSKLAKLCFLLTLFCAPVLAQNGPLQIQVSAYDGAELQTPMEEQRFDDPAIRAVVNMTNPTSGTITVSSVTGTFRTPDGGVLDQDQQGPVEIAGGQSGQVILYYANPSSLYQYMLDGAVNYQSEGQSYSAPIHVDTSEPATGGPYDDD